MSGFGADPRLAAAVLGVLGLLMTGTVGAAWFARVRPGATADNVRVRVRTWWAIAGVTLVALALGHPGLLLLFAAVSAQAWREYAGLVRPLPARAARGVGAVAVAALTVALALRVAPPALGGIALAGVLGTAWAGATPRAVPGLTWGLLVLGGGWRLRLGPGYAVPGAAVPGPERRVLGPLAGVAQDGCASRAHGQPGRERLTLPASGWGAGVDDATGGGGVRRHAGFAGPAARRAHSGRGGRRRGVEPGLGGAPGRCCADLAGLAGGAGGCRSGRVPGRACGARAVSARGLSRRGSAGCGF